MNTDTAPKEQKHSTNAARTQHKQNTNTACASATQAMHKHGTIARNHGMTAWRYSSSVGGNWQAYLNYIDSTGLERVVSTFGAIVDPTTAHFKMGTAKPRNESKG